MKYYQYNSENNSAKKDINYYYSINARADMDRIEVGKRIQTLREEKGISRCRLASEAGVSPSYIPELEAGKKCPTVEVLDNICDVLGVTLKEFFDYPTGEETYTFQFSSLTPTQRQLLVAFLKSL